jgi:spore maturation protein CgeB
MNIGNFLKKARKLTFSHPRKNFDKVKFYCANESTRARVAQAGYRPASAAVYAYIRRLQVVLKRFQIVNRTSERGNEIFGKAG